MDKKKNYAVMDGNTAAAYSAYAFTEVAAIYPITPSSPMAYDLFGDDSVHLVHVAGHTEGMFATLIRNGDRYVLLNADGAASPRSWAEGTVPGICENSVRAKKALDWIGGMSRDGACVASLCSHDPDVAPQTIEF